MIFLAACPIANAPIPPAGASTLYSLLGILLLAAGLLAVIMPYKVSFWAGMHCWWCVRKAIAAWACLHAACSRLLPCGRYNRCCDRPLPALPARHSSSLC